MTNNLGAYITHDNVALSSTGEGPLSGLNFAAKDLYDVAGHVTGAGSPDWLANHGPAAATASAVGKLLAAGADLAAKAQTDEMAFSITGQNAHYGTPVNVNAPGRIPGGSSSGSAAAVGASMMPAAIGTQVGGSIIRPAAYCGNVALKPTQGGINRGERQATSMSTHGVHANCIEDMWLAAIEIARRAGGDRGCLGLFGPDTPPLAAKPNRLIVLETAGWAILDDASKSAFEALLENLQQAGVTLLRRKDNALVEKLEQAIVEAPAICNAITRWENHWAQRNLVDQKGEFVSDRLKAGLAQAEAMSPDDYRAALLAREAAQRCHDAVGLLADAAITLSCPGPAPLWPGDIQGQPLAARPTGDAIFNTPSSMLFAPCVTMPLLAVGGMPLGVQVTGQQHQDAQMTAIARWMLDTMEPIIMGS